MTTTPYQIVEERCKKKQTFINDTIKIMCKDAHPYQWRAIAEDLCDKHLPSDEFEYMVAEGIGVVPTIAITRYLKPVV